MSKTPLTDAEVAGITPFVSDGDMRIVSWTDYECLRDFARRLETDRAELGEELRSGLLNLARQIEALKQPCSMDPESPQAIRNGTYMSLALNARALLARLEAK